jgi:hypothetical protein
VPHFFYNESMQSRGRKVCLFLLLGLLANGPPGKTSAQILDQRVGKRGPLTGTEEPPDPAAIQMQERQRKSLNAIRQKQLVSDADKLLRLAGELRSEVSDPQKAATSTAVLRKADQIEKLAKSVRDKMRAF